MVGISSARYDLTMKSNPLSPNPITANASPLKDDVARRAYSIYESQGSHPGQEVKHWLEAEAQLFGGIERETQINPNSPLFRKES
jgi:hypothetical protein